MNELYEKRNDLTAAMNKISSRSLADPVMISIDDWNSLTGKLSALYEVMDKWDAAIAHTLHEMKVMDESSGVAGYHLNGEIATWDETGLEDARNELKELMEFRS